MILGGDVLEPNSSRDGITLDDLFRRAGVSHPDAIALSDPPNRADFTHGAPQHLTYAEADRAISALARRLRQLGLRADTVIAIQLPNTVESIVAIMGVLRAGMIAAPMPLLWRKLDIVDALRRTGAKAIVTTSRIGSAAHGEIAAQAAAELFSIRFVCSFGRGLPDGVIPLDDIFEYDGRGSEPMYKRIGNPALHVASVTFESTAAGLAPVARNHVELIAAGRAVFCDDPGPLLSAIPVGSLAGLSLSIVPWLMHGGTLTLHHPFAPQAFREQCRAHAGSVALPGPTLSPLTGAGCLGDAVKAVYALWHSPERLPTATPWPGTMALIDVACFGETGLVIARREVDGVAGPMSCHIVDPPFGPASDGLEVTRTSAGTLAIRGAMVPRKAFPPLPPLQGEPHLEADDAGFVDTGVNCRLDRDGQTLIVTGPPPGTTTVGGYRFRQAQVEAVVTATDATATIVALPDANLGQRLAGSAENPAAKAKALTALGVNPLIAGAFLRQRMTHAA